jgi:hypothetical protein
MNKSVACILAVCQNMTHRLADSINKLVTRRVNFGGVRSNGTCCHVNCSVWLAVRECGTENILRGELFITW